MAVFLVYERRSNVTYFICLGTTAVRYSNAAIVAKDLD